VSGLIPVDCAVNDDYGSTSDRIAAIHFPGLQLDTCDMARAALPASTASRSGVASGPVGIS
jgi:hypothetical protein